MRGEHYKFNLLLQGTMKGMGTRQKKMVARTTFLSSSNAKASSLCSSALIFSSAYIRPPLLAPWPFWEGGLPPNHSGHYFECFLPAPVQHVSRPGTRVDEFEQLAGKQNDDPFTGAGT